MDFLVHINTELPLSMDVAVRENLILQEREYGVLLCTRGMIAHIWRIPGTTNNVGIWRCKNADELHEAIQKLPAYPWMTVNVTALSTHPLEAALNAN